MSTTGTGIIPREDIERVKAATDMVHLVSAHTQLKRSGSRFVGLCPFHSERTPSFSVNAEDCLYHCFGCQESGDCFNFVAENRKSGIRRGCGVSGAAGRHHHQSHIFAAGHVAQAHAGSSGRPLRAGITSSCSKAPKPGQPEAICELGDTAQKKSANGKSAGRQIAGMACKNISKPTAAGSA